MDEWECLRGRLVQYVKRKFYSRPEISELAEDIVDDAFADVWKDKDTSKRNFGYLAAACVHNAYRAFKRMDGCGPFTEDCLGFLDEGTVTGELLESEDTAEILASLDALRQIERVIILQRYYGDFSFAKIAEANHIKLNTVLSHHRRALEKLRPHLSAYSVGRTKQKTFSGKREVASERQESEGTFSKWIGGGHCYDGTEKID